MWCCDSATVISGCRALILDRYQFATSQMSIDASWIQFVRDHGTLHVPDVREQGNTPTQRIMNEWRTFLAAPLRQQGELVGTLSARRMDVRPFTPAQIKLLETFADQAVIAIENVRLFNELQERNRDLTEALEQQTATGEVLRVIASSPTDLQPVLDAGYINRRIWTDNWLAAFDVRKSMDYRCCAGADLRKINSKSVKSLNTFISGRKGYMVVLYTVSLPPPPFLSIPRAFANLITNSRIVLFWVFLRRELPPDLPPKTCLQRFAQVLNRFFHALAYCPGRKRGRVQACVSHQILNNGRILDLR